MIRQIAFQEVFALAGAIRIGKVARIGLEDLKLHAIAIARGFS